MYAAEDDPYSYPGTDVLKNLLDIKNADELQAFELEMTLLRSEEPLPAGAFDPSHYRAVHRHLFQDVYPWAGDYRTIRTAKGGNWFCYPEYIDPQMEQLFAGLAEKNILEGLSAEDFVAEAAAFLGMLNAIHPFREGNGRAQLAFLREVAEEAGHPVDLERIPADSFLAAMIASFADDLDPLKGQIAALLTA